MNDDAGIRAHLERRGVALRHGGDIRFVDLHLHLYLRQVGCDPEQHRRLNRRSDRLADIHVALDDDAVDGRTNDGVLDIERRLVDHGGRLHDDRLCTLHVRSRLIDGGACGVEIRFL